MQYFTSINTKKSHPELYTSNIIQHLVFEGRFLIVNSIKFPNGGKKVGKIPSRYGLILSILIQNRETHVLDMIPCLNEYSGQKYYFINHRHLLYYFCVLVEMHQAFQTGNGIETGKIADLWCEMSLGQNSKIGYRCRFYASAIRH
jgi:hypothetical protein